VEESSLYVDLDALGYVEEEFILSGTADARDPDGKVIAGPLHESQDLLMAEIDPQRMTGPRWQLDVAGHYARDDVLKLVVRNQ